MHQEVDNSQKTEESSWMKLMVGGVLSVSSSFPILHLFGWDFPEGKKIPTANGLSTNKDREWK